MDKKVKLMCKPLSKGFIAECAVQQCPDMENSQRFKVTSVYQESCAFYQLGECPNKDCVLASGENFSYYIVYDDNSVD